MRKKLAKYLGKRLTVIATVRRFNDKYLLLEDLYKYPRTGWYDLDHLAAHMWFNKPDIELQENDKIIFSGEVQTYLHYEDGIPEKDVKFTYIKEMRKLNESSN